MQNRVKYLEKEEKKYVLKIMAVRKKAEMVKTIRSERQNIMQEMQQDKIVNSKHREELIQQAKQAYESR